MKKGHKIKRYGNIYSPSSGSPVIFIAMLAGVVIFSLIGWTTYPFVYEFVSNLDKPAVTSHPPASSTVDTPVVGSEPASEPPVSEPAKQQPLKKGIYIPANIVNDAAAFDALLSNAADAGVSYALLDAKDVQGNVQFVTGNEVAIRSGAVSPTAFDAALVAQKITAAGLEPVARMHAFRDNIAAKANRSMAVGYYDTQYVWLDNAPELGGRAWLNPYSHEAAQYISDLIVELSQAGFSQVVLDSVTFPTGVGLDKASYGKDDYGKDFSQPKNQVIRERVTAFENIQMKHGIRCIVFLSEEALQSPDYITEPAWIMGTVSPQTSEGVDSAIASLKQKAHPEGGKVNLLLPTSRSDGSVMTAAELAALEEQAAKQGVSMLVYYHPEGSYSLQ